MSHQTAALPIAYVLLRILIVLNWAVGAAIIALLLIAPHEQWILKSFDMGPGPEADRLILGLRGIAVIGLVCVPINHAILKRLRAIIDTVRDGDPFVADNAYRLHAIGWALLSLQLLGLVIAAIVKLIDTPQHPVNIEAGFSVNGWLAVLLTFILARVFAEGTLMRRELEGTI